MTTPVLEVEDLVIRFGARERTLQVVDGLSFTVAEGETVAVVGESGCGKSVTALATVGLLPAVADVAATAIRVGGSNVYPFHRATLQQVRGRAVGFVFQEPLRALNPAMRIGRQLREVTARHLGLPRRQGNQRAIEYLDLVGIPHPAQVARMYPHELSGGMRQRVLIAAAILCDPLLLIADEPTTALDVTIQAGILETLRRLRQTRRLSILLVSHDLGVVADMAERVLVMYAGRIVESAPVDELFACPAHPYTQALLQAMPARTATRLIEIPGSVPTFEGRQRSCAFAPRCTRASDRCTTHVPELDRFAALHRVACFHPGPDAVPGGGRPRTLRTTP
jgi:peptide/nickel transport system ATP-binding protein